MRADTATPPSVAGQIRHLTGPQDLDPPLIDTLLGRAAQFEGEARVAAERSLEGRILATIFYEPSTRTRFSFEAAMFRLGGQVLSAESAGVASSAVKGESLEDAIRIVAGYADAIVLRHPSIGAAETAARVADVPVINAGDGGGHHPTQALLDLYTIRKELGRLEHLRVGLVGDLRNGRTARSLALLLANYPGNKLVLVSPAGLRMGEDVAASLRRSGQAYRETDDLAGVVSALDVLYQTRIQAERFATPEEYERFRGVYVVDPALMRRLPASAIVMHPLPRVGEIDPRVDDDPRAAYFRQARNGLFVRMAVLEWAMGR